MEVVDWFNSFYQAYPITFLTTKVKTKAAAGSTFNYILMRKLIHTAALRCNKSTRCHMSVIAPYGFELLPQFPGVVRRHYPAMGYPKNMSLAQAQNYALLFIANFLDLAQQLYPSLYRSLVYCGIHNGGHYSTIHNGNARAMLDKASTMHIELFQTDDILLHYANYLIALIAVMATDELKLPEACGFMAAQNSKTKRNRFFQLFVICNQLTQTLMPQLPSFNLQQKQLYHELFMELRRDNPSETILDVTTQFQIVTPTEYRIRDELILPRLEQIRNCLQRVRGQRTVVASNVYYGAGEPIVVGDLPLVFVRRAQLLIKQSYAYFPRRAAMR